MVRRIASFAGPTICFLIACFWGYWGAFENFHEGWYYRTLGANLTLAFVQYWAEPLLFLGLGCVAVLWPRWGSILFVMLGLAVNGFLFRFQNFAGLILIGLPCLILAACFWGVKFEKRGRVAMLVGIPPILLMIGISVPLAIRVSHRRTEIPAGPLPWHGLVWAPKGPGWPNRGVSYEDALDRCARLDRDGVHLGTKRIKYWRLPTVQESIGALNRDGAPAGCTFERAGQFQPCPNGPDKEAPLWDPYSMVIYWWTATEAPNEKVLRVAYNGYVLPVPRKSVAGYTAFRAVHSERQ